MVSNLTPCFCYSLKFKWGFFVHTLFSLPLTFPSFSIFFSQSVYYNVIESRNVLLRRSIFLLRIFRQTNNKQKERRRVSSCVLNVALGTRRLSLLSNAPRYGNGHGQQEWVNLPTRLKVTENAIGEGENLYMHMRHIFRR